MTKEASIKRTQDRWVARYGATVEAFKTMKDAAQWLEECAEKDRDKEKERSEHSGKLCR